LTIPEALAIARQIVDALDSAHQKGIVHRDLKPANIVLQRDANAAGVPTGSVRAKVLDFGLAKTMAVDAGDARSRAASFDGTADGRILGTPAYMSPEQARGHPVDKRTDVWAFGCVLFEMLAGRRAFDGGSVSDTLVAILEREPAWSDLPTDTPAAIRALLRRCLQKDPHERLRDIADARLVIVDGDTAGIPASVVKNQERLPHGRSRAVRAMEIAAAFLVGALLAAGSFAWWQDRAAVTTSDSLEFGVGPPPSTTFPFLHFSFAIAPDGKHLAMVVGAENTLALWIRSFESGALRRLPGTELVRTPFWSPDSRRIAFFSGGKLKTVGVTGDSLNEVCEATAAGDGSHGGTWNQNGIILFGLGSGPLLKVAATGGTPAPVTSLNETDTSHRYPWFLPDGQHFLFLALGRGRHQLRLGSLTSTDSTPLGTIRSNAVYAAGHLSSSKGDS
jgi:eukaryotic-like serine/threonine-protein kinase